MIQKIARRQPILRTLTCSMLLAGSCALAKEHGESNSGTPFHVTHILGFESASNNASGDLSIERDALRFQKSGGSSAQITIASIHDLILGEQDKQMGGTPMTVGKVAAPFGGGRVIGLFAHKKYDTVTLEYIDINGGSHGAIFQLNKGQGQILKNALRDAGAPVGDTQDSTAKPVAQEANHEVK